MSDQRSNPPFACLVCGHWSDAHGEGGCHVVREMGRCKCTGARAPATPSGQADEMLRRAVRFLEAVGHDRTDGERLATLLTDAFVEGVEVGRRMGQPKRCTHEAEVARLLDLYAPYDDENVRQPGKGLISRDQFLRLMNVPGFEEQPTSEGTSPIANRASITPMSNDSGVDTANANGPSITPPTAKGKDVAMMVLARHWLQEHVDDSAWDERTVASLAEQIEIARDHGERAGSRMAEGLPVTVTRENARDLFGVGSVLGEGLAVALSPGGVLATHPPAIFQAAEASGEALDREADAWRVLQYREICEALYEDGTVPAADTPAGAIRGLLRERKERRRRDRT